MSSTLTAPLAPLATFRAILSLFRRIGIRPAYFLIPVSISLAAAVFEGVGFGLLIPLIEGFFAKDFSFLKEAPVLGIAVQLLPSWILSTDRWLFIFLLGLFAISFLLKNLLKYCSLVSIAYIGNRAVHHLRKTLFNRYVSFGKLYFDTSHVGHHSAVLSQFAPQALAPLQGIGRFMNALFSIIAYLTLLPCSASRDRPSIARRN
jgi:ABC-type multidrug transport system fused ATPase/permease subunit